MDPYDVLNTVSPGTQRAGLGDRIKSLEASAATSVQQPSPAITALTDSSTGTSGGNTIAAVTDVASAANAIATLSAKLNAVIAALNG